MKLSGLQIMKNVEESLITQDVIDNAYTYESYRKLIDELLEENKTTGPNQSEEMAQYTKMNVHRMKRLDKQVEVNEDLIERVKQIKKPVVWLVITEGWCGDAAQIIPALEKIAEQTPNIQTRYILRDENLEIMDQYLTNGKSRSIPKLVCLDAETLDVLGDWGPRPEELQNLYFEWTADKNTPFAEVAEKIQKWYAKDKTESIQKEVGKLISDWNL